MNRTRRFNSPFQLEHYRKILLSLLERGDVEFITYNDLCWQPRDDHRAGYPAEWKAWREKLSRGLLSSEKVYVLIQHDSDSGPYQTMEMIALEAEYGIPSSVMIFERWRGAREDGEIEDYPLDFDFLKRAESLGFCFGYHCNALHNCDFDRRRVFDYFSDDVYSLSKKLNIQVFSAHGGAVRDGVGNASFDYIKATRTRLKHVHNGATVRFNSTFSDGGFFKRLKENQDSVNVLKWCESLKPGGRYRLLIHPQYFSDENYVRVENIGEGWYKDFTAC